MLRRRSSVTLSLSWTREESLSTSGDYTSLDAGSRGGGAAGRTTTMAPLFPVSPPTEEIAFFPLPPHVDIAGHHGEAHVERGAGGGRSAPPPAMPKLGGGGSSKLHRKVNAAAASMSSFPAPPDVPPKTPQTGKKLISIGERVMGDDVDIEDLSFGSVETVTSSQFSEGMADDIWAGVESAPEDAVMGVAQAYRACDDPRKVDVCVGAYRDERGKPWVLPSVRRAERILLDRDEDKEYLPIDGDRDFVEAAMKFAYGRDMPMEHLAAIQTLSGTGAWYVANTNIICR
jgi:hypothetical protein